MNGDGFGFLKGIRFTHCLDTIAEWHALVQGFGETFCPWEPRRPFLSEDLASEIRDNHHYYTAGRALGVIAWLTIVIIVKEVFF